MSRLSFKWLLFFSAVLVSGALGQNINKPYTTWSTGDAQKLLTDSPWAKTYSSIESRSAASMGDMRRTQRDTVNSGGGNPGSQARSGGNLPVIIRLHSSPIVRQATVRLQQIGAKYDKMSEEEKAAFDQSRKGFLECAICKDYYVVTITKMTDSSGETVSNGIFETIKLEDIKDHVTLVNEKGEKRQLVQFTPSKGGGDPSIFFFKRLDENGKPLLTPDSKELEFVFTGTFIDWNKRDAGLYPRKFEFSVSKMMSEGTILF